MSRLAAFLSLLPLVQSHNYVSGKNLDVHQRRKSFCSLLSFNGDNRNPSPIQCERAARKVALGVCEELKNAQIAAIDDDVRCMSFLQTRQLIRDEDCGSEKEDRFPLFVRVTCNRFGDVKQQFSVYDLIESIAYLDPNGAYQFRFKKFTRNKPFDYFESSFWVFERETRCHGLISTAVVKVTEPGCVSYYNDESTAVCNYLRTIFDDLWDLGCLRARGTILDMAKWHCTLAYNAQLGKSQNDFCVARGFGEDVSCDAIELLCGSQSVWNVDDIGLPPYFLDDVFIENYNTFNAEGAEGLTKLYSSPPEESEIPRQASLDFLQHAVKGWRIPFAQEGK